MESQINQLKNRIFSKKGKGKATELTNILYMCREFGCLGEIIGRNFEIRNSEDKLIYKIKQKPMAVVQMNNLLKEFETIKKLDNEREEEKWGSKKGKKMMGRR